MIYVCEVIYNKFRYFRVQLETLMLKFPLEQIFSLRTLKFILWGLGDERFGERLGQWLGKRLGNKLCKSERMREMFGKMFGERLVRWTSRVAKDGQVLSRTTRDCQM